MTFTSMIKTFVANESGAVTVDWVVLTAAIVGLGLAVITSVRSGVTALGSDI
jgi:Flp pilus assembly pilin Flp